MQRFISYVLALCIMSVPAFGTDEEAIPGHHVTERDRLWANFGRESAVVGSGKLRLGTQAMAINYGSEDPETDLTGFPINDFERALGIAGTPDTIKAIEGTRIDIQGAYGLGPTMEIGVDVPVYLERISFDGSTEAINTEDIGDVVVHAKFRKMVSSSTAIGAGLEISTPTGAENKRLGTGELGFNPFVNARYTSGGFAVGGHIGFQMFENSVEDVLNYSAFLIARRNECLAFRIEVNGRFLRQPQDDFHDVSILPGLDVSITDRITLRPQAMFGLNDDAYTWGAGLGAVVELF